MILICCSFLLATNVLAYSQENQNEFIKQTAGGTGLSKAEFTGVVAGIVNVVLGIVGAIFVALIIYGGTSWIIAAGSPDKIGKAKKIIIYAIIGLIVVASAYVISYFISTSIG